MVKPGKPLQILENNVAKRKSHTQVALSDKRLFELDLKPLLISKPEAAFIYLLPLLGLEFNSTAFKLLISEFRLHDTLWTVANTDRRGIGVSLPEWNTTFSIEELLAMILRDAKEIAEKAAGEKISDCVLTINPTFGTAQRLALADVLKLANLTPLAFLNENLAAAVRYSIDREPENGTKTKKPIRVMYLNMGAGSFKVTIVNYSQEIESVSQKLTEKLEIIGEAVDYTLGGRQFDYELAEVLAAKFNDLPIRKNKPDVRTNPKAMRKILEKAEELKEKLSATKTLRIYIDNLVETISLSVYIIQNNFLG